MARYRAKIQSSSELQRLKKRQEQANREQTGLPAPPAAETPAAAWLPDPLRDAASAMNALVEGIRDAAALLSSDRTILACNRLFAALLGLERDQILGRSIVPFVHSEDHPALLSLLQSYPDDFERLRVRLTGSNEPPVPAELVVKTLAVNGTRVTSLLATDLRHDRRVQHPFRFQAFILDNISDAVAAADEQNRITYWNAAAERLYGYTAAEALGRNANEVVRSEVTPEQRAAYIKEMRETGRLNTEVTHYDRHGNRLRIYGMNTVLRDADGRLIGYAAVSHDITELRRDEQQLREQALLLDLTQDAILVRDPQSRITYWNRGAEAMYGWTQEEAVGSSVQDLLRTQLPRPLAEIERAVEQEGHWEGDLVHTTRAGHPIPVHSRWSLLRDDQGHPSAILQINTDITERKRAENAIRELNADLERRVAERTADLARANQELLREIEHREQIERDLREAERQANDLVRYAPAAIYEIDFHGQRFTRVNDSMCQTTGYTREELLAMNPLDLMDEHSKSSFQERVRKTLAAEPIDETVEYKVRSKDGRTLYAVIRTRLLYQNGTPIGAFVIAHDITERKRAEKQIEALNRDLARRAVQLETANKELESFSYSLSHDLRMPLASISNFSRLLFEDYASDLPPGAQRCLGFIQAHVDQMSQLVESLLNFSRLTRQPLKKQVVDMAALVRDALEVLQAQVQMPDLTVEIGELPEAKADPVLLKQVWMNLIGNALKFSRQSKPARIEIGCGRIDGEERVYYVRDNGVGFDPEQSERLFGVFQRLHGEDEYEGTGIGLAIVQRIIHRHGGRVWAEGEQGKGATFYFTIEGNPSGE